MQLNEDLLMFMPCQFCWYFGLILAPLTCGLSLLCPRVCATDAEDKVRRRIDIYNNQILTKKGLKLKLIHKCSKSWLEFQTFTKEEEEYEYEEEVEFIDEEE